MYFCDLCTLSSCLDFDLWQHVLLWLSLLLLGVSVFYNRDFYFKQRLFVLSNLTLIWGLVTLGVQPTLTFMGLVQVGVACCGRSHLILHCVSFRSPPLPPSLPPSPSLQLLNKGVFMFGLTANRGLFQTKHKMSDYQDTREGWTKLMKDIFLTKGLPYNWFYLFICFLGLVGHEFLYCILVGVVTCL